MEIEFDTTKDIQNRRKHGIPLATALLIFETQLGSTIDDRRDYGEVRINCFGLIGDRLYVCTYTSRGDARRIISVRKTSRQEQALWQS